MTPRFVNGLRVTDEATIEVVKMVLTGKVGPDLVSRIPSASAAARSASPVRTVRHCSSVPRRASRATSSAVSGRSTHVNVEPILSISTRGGSRLASIGLGYDGEAYNVNADTVAAEVAVALRATKLILLTDVDGVHGGDGSLLSELDPRAGGGARRGRRHQRGHAAPRCARRCALWTASMPRTSSMAASRTRSCSSCSRRPGSAPCSRRARRGWRGDVSGGAAGSRRCRADAHVRAATAGHRVRSRCARPRHGWSVSSSTSSAGSASTCSVTRTRR